MKKILCDALKLPILGIVAGFLYAFHFFAGVNYVTTVIAMWFFYAVLFSTPFLLGAIAVKMVAAKAHILFTGQIVASVSVAVWFIFAMMAYLFEVGSGGVILGEFFLGVAFVFCVGLSLVGGLIMGFVHNRWLVSHSPK